ncbi:MAG: DMT family transporter [Dorea sp.]
MKTEVKNYFYIFIAGSLWGTIGLFVKLMTASGSSATYTSFLRMLIGFFMLAVITLIKDGVRGFVVDKRTLGSCFLLGLICQAIYNLAYSNAVNMIGLSLSAVLLYTAPVFTSVISFLFFKEKIGRQKRLALVVNIIGCVLTVTGGTFAGLSFGVTGLLCGIAAGFCYSLSAVFGRLATGNASPFAVATYNFLFASIFLGIFMRPWTTVAEPFDIQILLIGAGFALIPTAFGYIFYFKGLQKIKETSKVPVIASVETVVATIIGIVIFHEKLGIWNLIGIILVLSSIAIMNLNFTKGTALE